MRKAKYLKTLSLCLVVLMALMSLAACGNNGDQNASSSGESEQQTSAAAGDAPETIKIGYVTPFTGGLAEFGSSIRWVVDLALPILNADGGFYIKEYDKRIPVEIIFADSESNPTKAAEAAQKLVTTDNVNILVGAWTPDTTMSVSAVAERNAIPAFMENSPIESWLEGGPYTWTYSLMFSVANMMEAYFDAWDKVDTNKKIGFIFDNNVDGIVMAPMVKEIADRRGYTVVDPGRFPMSTPDYSSMINQFKQEGCDIIVANAITPDYAVFLQQFYQMSYIPKIMTVGKAIHFEADALTVGSAELANGLMSEIHWDRAYPYDSPLLGMTVNEICDKWEAEHDSPYPTTIANDLTCLEVLAALLETAQTLDKETLRDTFPLLSGPSTYGEINFNEDHVFENPLVIVQYVLGEKYPLEKNIIASGKFTMIPESDEPIVIMSER
jgi:branched-chain amino acid transport system substrate-binding protein